MRVPQPFALTAVIGADDTVRLVDSCCFARLVAETLKRA